MSTKKQISSLCKLYSIYEETPEEFLDEKDVDSYFCHNILDVSQSHNRIIRVSKGSNKKSLAFKVFQFCDSKLKQRYILKEEVSISKKEIESLLDSLAEYLEAFDQANKVSQIPLPKSKFENWLTKAKDELFTHCYKDIVEHLNRQVRLSFWFEKNKDCVFSIKKFEQNGDQFILTEVVNLSYREIKHLYKNRFFFCLQVWHFWEQLHCVVHSPLIVRMTIVPLLSLGTCFAQIQSVWLNFACTKRLFNLPAEAIINARNAHLCARCGKFLLKIKQIPFSCRLVQGFTFLKRVHNQFKMSLKMCIVPVSIASTEWSANLLVVM